LTEEQRAFFDEEGYLVIPNALTPEELARARRAAGAAEALWRADPALPGVRRPDLEQVLGIMEYDPVLFELLEHPRLFSVVRDLVGPSVMMLDHDYFITPPGAEIPNGWHFDFDMPAVDHPNSRLMVKVFYVLEDVPPDGGATLVLPRSHRTPLGTAMPNSEVPEDLPGAVQMALPAGSAYLITGRTYHSAGNNRSNAVRRLLIYTYGHKWMRMWDEYRPSPALAARAETPMRRQLLGLTDPYALTPGPSPDPSLPPSPGEGRKAALGEGSWEENGYLVIENALSPAELAAARRAADAAEAAWRADPSRPGTRIPEFLELEGILEYAPLFLDLAVHPRIFPLIREALSEDVALIDHAFYITPPGGVLDGDAWHTDVRTRVPGVHHAGSTMMVRAMIALEDIPEDGGATLVLPGTHRQPDATPIPRVASPEEMPGAVALACKAGAAYFFNGNLLHSPGTNRGTTTRRVLLFNYGHKWMRMWQGHEPSPRLAAWATTPLRRQLLGLTPPYRGPEAELES
jgi:ectoine hydroxylase-related dioxygenase (phytanoyl-CoA dioxygenase family)